jgi:hypothetical protein
MLPRHPAPIAAAMTEAEDKLEPRIRIRTSSRDALPLHDRARFTQAAVLDLARGVRLIAIG